jgi:hypothetical protein
MFEQDCKLQQSLSYKSAKCEYTYAFRSSCRLQECNNRYLAHRYWCFATPVFLHCEYGRQCTPVKECYWFTKLHGVISQKSVVWILTAVKTSGADWRVDLRIRTQVTKIMLLEFDLEITPGILWQDTICIICRFAFVLLYSGRLVNIMFALAATFSPQHFFTVLPSCRLNIQTVPRHPPSHVISKRLLFKKQRRSHVS